MVPALDLHVGTAMYASAMAVLLHACSSLLCSAECECVCVCVYVCGSVNV